MTSDNDNPNPAVRAQAAARRQKALEELQQQVRTQRARLDPAVLARVAKTLGEAAAPAAGTAPNSVPYDRAAATRAIELFIATHKDKADFKARLFTFIQKQSH